MLGLGFHIMSATFIHSQLVKYTSTWTSSKKNSSTSVSKNAVTYCNLFILPFSFMIIYIAKLWWLQQTALESGKVLTGCHTLMHLDE